MVELLVSIPNRTSLCINGTFDLKTGSFESFYEILNKWQMEHSYFKFTEFSTVICYFNVDGPFLLILIIEYLGINSVRNAWMGEERIDIITTVSNKVIALLEFNNESILG